MIPILLLAAAAAAATPPAPSPKDDAARFDACVAQIKNDPDKALVDAQAWVKQADNIASRHCLGLALAADEQWLPAATTFTRAATAAEAQRDGRAAMLWSQAGNAAIAGDEASLARTALDRALGMGGLTETMQGEAWLDRSRADVALNDMAAARLDIDRGLKLAPDDPFGWLLSATLARRQDDLPRASRDISSAAHLAPDDAAVALEAGNIAMAAGAEQAAKLAWEKARSFGPNETAGQAATAQLAELAKMGPPPDPAGATPPAPAPAPAAPPPPPHP